MINRLKFLGIIFVFLFIALLIRLFYWQIYRGKELSTQARTQYRSDSAIKAPRGNILSSDKTWLASTQQAWLVYAELPELKENSKEIAEKIAPFFIDEKNNRNELLLEIDRLHEIMGKKDVVWVPLRHKISDLNKNNIESLDIKGIGFEKEETRFYPEASSSAHLLGFVGKDEQGEDKGYFGLEGYYDVVLSGKPGYLTREEDASGLPILTSKSKEIPAIGGVDLLTHIDKGIQLTLDKKLKEGIEKYGALGGTAIVMNPKNGAIMGMSSYPSYDPIKYYNFGNEFFNNPAISSSFEPGSIFKVIVMASALDSGVLKPEDVCSICSGPIKVDKYLIETWNKRYNPNSTMTDIIVNSDNVGMVFVSQKLGIDKMYRYLSDFGFGSKTGIDLQGEMNPGLREKGDWSIVDLSTAGFGQGIAVTSIQMIRGVGVIANKGIQVTPQVVDKIVGQNWEEDVKPVIGKRVISEKAAMEITSMMVEAAKRGESKWTYVRGFKVAGKTGTAQIPISGHYDEDKTIASFVGFAPYDDPKFVMLVTLQQPSSSPWASETAAPLWYSIAKDLFVQFGIQPEN